MATPRAFVWFAARPESNEETRASLSPRFPPCATEPSDESYVEPSGCLCGSDQLDQQEYLSQIFGGIMSNGFQLPDLYFAFRLDWQPENSTLYRFNLTCGQFVDIGDRLTPIYHPEVRICD
ncbi:hypothetical protein HPB50_020656 [Hyalomma asiaticum]|uniref:Uncharacterized protein n=1 Tax=Hyalomma asiaticum TaxID=266040 RepID=A0ACB7RNK0_HYAAI|nr:hypothetical protein HPB50_020656 [Hyalomma asiaticum]